MISATLHPSPSERCLSACLLVAGCHSWRLEWQPRGSPRATSIPPRRRWPQSFHNGARADSRVSILKQCLSYCYVGWSVVKQLVKMLKCLTCDIAEWRELGWSMVWQLVFPIKHGGEWLILHCLVMDGRGGERRRKKLICIYCQKSATPSFSAMFHYKPQPRWCWYLQSWTLHDITMQFEHGMIMILVISSIFHEHLSPVHEYISST